MSLKYHKIFNHDHINSRELSEVYMSDSSDHGRLFILLELPKQKTDQQVYVDEIINEIATFFDTSKQENPEILLEETLQHINQILPALSSSTKIRNWLNTLDLCVGIIYQNDVYMASIGNINGLLIHNKQITTILSKNNEINPSKAFSDIISGQLDSGDSLIISTNSLFDYISKEKIRQIIARYSPSAAAIKINELLETVPDFVTFNSLIIKNSNESDLNVVPQENKQLEIEYEKESSDIIKTNKNRDIQSPSPRTKTVVDLGAVKNTKTIQKASSFFSLFGLWFKLIRHVFQYSGQKIKYLFLFIFSSPFRKKKEAKTIDNINKVSHQKYYWFQNLSIKKKIAVISVFVIVLIFLQSLVFLTQEKADEQKNQDFNNALIAVEAKYQEVDSKLIYNDDQAAENIMLEIQEIIATMKASSPDQQSQIDTLTENAFHRLNKIRKIHVVPSPVVIFDLSSTVSNSSSIVQKDDIFYVLADNQLYQIKDNTLENIFSFAGGQVAQSMTDWPDTDKLVISALSANQELTYFIFNISNKEISGSLERTSQNESVADLAIYGNNLYVLDASANQIFKYAERGSGFSGGQTWLQDDIDIKEATSLTIDGSIYLIDNNGKIINFLKGYQEEYDYHQPRPLIGQNATIKTFRDSNYLYIIDPNNQRVIIMDKEGNIKDQYASQKFNNLKDLAVDKEEKAIYLLNGNNIYLLAINQ